jgi:hypothetical protein
LINFSAMSGKQVYGLLMFASLALAFLAAGLSWTIGHYTGIDLGGLWPWLVTAIIGVSVWLDSQRAGMRNAWLWAIGVAISPLLVAIFWALRRRNALVEHYAHAGRLGRAAPGRPLAHRLDPGAQLARHRCDGGLCRRHGRARHARRPHVASR